MRPTLPRLITAIPRAGAILFALLAGLAACHHSEPVVAPGPPLPAEGVLEVGTMQLECDALLAALESWKHCPNLVENEVETIDAWMERAQLDFAAGTKAKPEPKAQQAIATRCRRATDSVKAAVERCSNGPRPKS